MAKFLQKHYVLIFNKKKHERERKKPQKYIA